MTTRSLARSYLKKATVRLEILQVLSNRGAYSDVVREAQGIVELALKAMLRHVGVEPPKWHDVGTLLFGHADKFPTNVRADLARLAAISKWLRKERELAFYGDEDFLPDEEYSKEDAQRASDDASFVVARVKACVDPPAEPG